MDRYFKGLFSALSSQRQSWLVVGVSLLLGWLFYVCFWNQTPGLSVPVYFGLVVAASWLLLGGLDRGWPRVVWLVAVLAAYLTVMLAWRDSSALRLINLATLFALGLLSVWLLAGRSWQMRIVDYVGLAYWPLFWIRPFLNLIGRCFVNKETSSRNVSAIVSGVVITVPVVAVLLFLFIRSDGTLAALLGNLFQFNVETLASWMVVVVVAAWFAAAFSCILFSQPSEEVLVEDKRILGLTESTILLVAVNVVFALFLLAQVVYLFGGEAYLAHTATTYAGYARQGFTELVLVALIAAGVVWVSRPQLAQKTHLGQFGMLLAAQVLIVLASAASRLWLYEQAYGFTIARLVGHIFMIWLAVVFVVILLHIKGIVTARLFGPVIVGLMILAVVGLNMLNPDAFIAQRNIDRYHQTGKVDLTYLNRLSNDAVPALVVLLNVPNKGLAYQASLGLKQRLSNDSVQADGKWQSWNRSRSQAMTLLQQRLDAFTGKPVDVPLHPEWED